jgi:(S)-sulfolactate dehydrogenase
MASIFVSEFITTQALEQLRSKHHVIYEPEAYLDRAHLIASLHSVEALIVRNLTRVDQALLNGAPQLQVVGRLGVGLENIDLPGCAERKITVIPATGANAESVAEYVVGAALVLMRGMLPATTQTLGGSWPRAQYSGFHELLGKTMGIVGLGSIGRVSAKKARAFGLQCLAYDPALQGSSADLDGSPIPLVSLEQLLADSDVVSLHLPLSPQTRGLFSASVLDQMKHGAFLINTARGSIVDELALADRLRSGRLGGAAIDVFEQEPANDLSHFSNIPNLILTPHVSGLTQESNDRVCTLIANKVMQFLEARQ